MLMGMFMKGSGWKIRLMGSVYIAIWTDQNMKDTGKRTSKMAKDWRFSLMDLNMPVTICRV